MCSFWGLASAQQIAYVVNNESNSVSIVDIANKKVTATISVGKDPFAATISKDGKFLYVTNTGSNNVSVIDTTKRLVEETFALTGSAPSGIAISLDGHRAYIANVSASRTTG
jgi:YVTN family beta-propeller protein